MWKICSLRCQARFLLNLQTAVVDAGQEAVPQFAPLVVEVSGIDVIRCIHVQPMLETIDDGHVGEEENIALQFLSEGSLVIGFVVETAFVLCPVGRAQQFHGHGCHLAEFHRRILVPDQRLAADGFGVVEGMSTLVQERDHVVGAANCIHEDVGLFADRETFAIAARRLVGTAGQVKIVWAHRFEIAAQNWIDLVEYLSSCADQVIDFAEGMQGRVVGIDLYSKGLKYPSPRGVIAPAPVARQCFCRSSCQGDDLMFDGVVERESIFRRVAEARSDLPLIGAIVAESSIFCHLTTQGQHFSGKDRLAPSHLAR